MDAPTDSLSTGSVLAAAVLTGAPAMAAPITLPVSPLFIQYTNNEQFSLTNSIHSTNPTTGAATSEGNWGILQISSIVKGTALNPPGSDIQGAELTYSPTAAPAAIKLPVSFTGPPSIPGA